MPLRISSPSLRRLLRPRPALVLVALVAACAALVASAAPRLEVALAEQYELAAQRPYDAAVQNDLGNLLLLAGREEAAAEAYRRALEIDGSHVRARFNLALLEQQNGRHQEALDEFEALLEVEPDHAWAHYQSGVSLQELDRRKDAVEHYARAFGLDPTISFAENNPHIIDNTMVTEALLLSSRYGDSASRTVARQYDDAERIAILMLDPKPATGEAEEKVAEGNGEDRPVQRVTTTGTGARLDDEPVLQADPGGDAVVAGEPEDESSRRTITEDDLETGVQVGGAVGPRETRTRPDIRGRLPHTSTGIDLRSNTRRDASPRQAPRDLGGERYRPPSSRRSSASLDLRLLPEEDLPADDLAIGP